MTHYAKKLSDEDRVRLAKPASDGKRMLGPLELERCAVHPRKWETFRWTWPTPTDGDHMTSLQSDSEPRTVRPCESCSEGFERDVMLLQAANGTRRPGGRR